jgi:type II secretory pathway component PulF
MTMSNATNPTPKSVRPGLVAGSQAATCLVLFLLASFGSAALLPIMQQSGASLSLPTQIVIKLGTLLGRLSSIVPVVIFFAGVAEYIVLRAFESTGRSARWLAIITWIPIALVGTLVLAGLGLGLWAVR